MPVEILQYSIYGLIALLLLTSSVSAVKGTNMTNGFHRQQRSSKKRWAWATLTTLILLICVAEFSAVQEKPDRTLLFWVHLVFAIPLLFMLGTAVLWKTGIRDPVWHTRLVYPVLILIPVVSGMGGMLAYQLK